MASFDLLKESFNWRKGGSFRWMPPPPKEDDLKIKSWVQTKYKRFYNQQLNLWKNPSLWPHLSSPPILFFLTNFVHLYTSFTTKPWKNNRRIFDFFHDDTPVTNAIRKWGPVQLLLLQDGSSEGPRGRPVDDSMARDRVIPRLVFLHFKKREAYLDIWSWGGMIWWEKSRNWKNTLWNSIISNYRSFCWVLAVPFLNRHDLGCTQPYATEETQQVPWIHWSNPCCRSDRTLSTAYGSRGPPCGFLENGCRVFEGFFLDVRGRRNYSTDGHVELSLLICCFINHFVNW